jgi:outer membrane protein assembly factor BamE (lipoprotein component of BamABCDE complex)
MKSLFFLLVAAAMLLFLPGCATPGAGYAAKHPELTPGQRQILITGKIPPGEDVAGLTREQVKLAVGKDPATYDKVGDQDVWIYVQKKAVSRDKFADMRGNDGGTSSMENTHSFTESEDFAPRSDVDVKTRIFFRGNAATGAQVSEERP